MSDAPRGASGRRIDAAGLGLAAGLAALALLTAWDATQISGGAAYARIGPQAFPFAIAFGLFVLAGATATVAVRAPETSRPAIEWTPVVWIVGGLAAQNLLLGFAGFSIATGVLFACTAKAFGRGPLHLTFPIGAAIALALWLAFAKGLSLTLPAGPLERLF